jgi:hypothetical protein
MAIFLPLEVIIAVVATIRLIASVLLPRYRAGIYTVQGMLLCIVGYVFLMFVLIAVAPRFLLGFWELDIIAFCAVVAFTFRASPEIAEHKSLASMIKLADERHKRDMQVINAENSTQKKSVDGLDFPSLMAKAEIHFKAERLDMALEPLLLARRLKPGEFDVRYMLAEIYRKKGFNDRAKIEYREAMRLAPGLPEEKKKIYLPRVQYILSELESQSH